MRISYSRMNGWLMNMAKVRYVYDRFGLGDRTEIEFFSGGHSMRCVGTFAFLHKHLNWP